ncbi:MAG: hypothetical protein C4516_04265 [Oxalobacter sp.]|jgi:hypothetical protein|nr:MAG: hypothetical protein C4516_04265 [Oxalobacter sp.]
MARHAKKAPEIIDVPVNEEQFATATQAANALALANSQAAENANALASHLGYEGALTVGALEDEIRFYQRRTVEACLELGKRLLILKELTQHGEFRQRLDLLGINDRMARKFMSATLKFSNRTSKSVLTAAGTQTKLLELVILDDGEIEALESGDSVRGLTLDKIETMSVSELKAALRDAKGNAEATSRILADKNKKIDELAAAQRRIAKLPPDAEGEQIRKETIQLGYSAELGIRGALYQAFLTLQAHTENTGIDHREFMGCIVALIDHACVQLVNEFGLQVPTIDAVPAWITEDIEKKA